jgi:tetratricopeptide (TPR) repeat protein
MKVKLLLVTFFALSQLLLVAQNDKSLYREYFIQGDLLIMEDNYEMALKSFLDAYKIDSTNANINYKVGLCYLKSATEKNKALPFLEKAIQNVGHNYMDMEPREKKAPEMAYYQLGVAYRLQYKFNESNNYFNKFKDIVGEKNKDLAKDLDKQVETNFNAIEFTKDTAEVSIISLGDSINSIYPEYSPLISADESIIIFTSRRPTNVGAGSSSIGEQIAEDILLFNKKEGWYLVFTKIN